MGEGDIKIAQNCVLSLMNDPKEKKRLFFCNQFNASSKTLIQFAVPFVTKQSSHEVCFDSNLQFHFKTNNEFSNCLQETPRQSYYSHVLFTVNSNLTLTIFYSIAS